MNSPTNDLLIFILALSSRFHLTVGCGLPVARHFNVTLDPSRTITSLELSESSIFGGTEITLKKIKHFWNLLKTEH